MLGRTTFTTLFHEAPQRRSGPSGFAASALLHLCVLSLWWLYLGQRVYVANSIVRQRYNVKLINVRTPERMARGEQAQGGDSAATGLRYPAPVSPVAHAASGDQSAHAANSKVALLQPDLPKTLPATMVPLPQVLIWTPDVSTSVTVRPPSIQTANAPILKPSPDPPNREKILADVRLSSTDSALNKLALPASTTSPVVVHRPFATMQLPSTITTESGPATPAQVASLSEMALEKGTIALPPINTGSVAVVTKNSGEGTGAAGSNKSEAGKTAAGNGSNGGNGSGTGQSGSGNSVSHEPMAGSGVGLNQVGISGDAGDSGDVGTRSIAEIRQPMDGQFNAVVIGSSLAEKYPETTRLWAGRLAYTVYLHVGLGKNWILQYAVVREKESVDGGAAQPNAPWPYLMECPHLIPGDVDSDALMVHGRLNTDGHFEALKILFPVDFAQASFVLKALQQWQFRPARQEGRLIPVEILLIIPEED